jgi:hypothetical protein
MFALKTALEYVVTNKIEGAIVECGVWRGGSMMLAAKVLSKLGEKRRELFLFDTFEGMTSPSAEDRDIHNTDAKELLAQESVTVSRSVWCYADIDDVNHNMMSTGYPPELVHLIKGRVEDTIPVHAPPQIAILRLDTDWYESTLHELVHLFPRLSTNAVLIIDDYGHWQGARRAVDEYFSAFPMKPLLHRIDYTGRMIIKCVN